MTLEFDWDPAKASSNVEKHGVSFYEAATVFGDPLAITFHDLDHSFVEDRFITFGQAANGMYVSVVHTDRGDRTRIISARPMTRQERRQYEELP